MKLSQTEETFLHCWQERQDIIDEFFRRWLSVVHKILWLATVFKDTSFISLITELWRPLNEIESFVERLKRKNKSWVLLVNNIFL